MSDVTVVGGNGFIGSALVGQLTSLGFKVFVPTREYNYLCNRSLGTLIYCAGHGDCKGNPIKVLHSNLVFLSYLLERANFEKLIYISSARIYVNQLNSAEDADVSISSYDDRKLFNLTKLTAEELCLLSGLNICIVRPSNVYGLAVDSNLFLPSIIRDAINHKLVNMYVSPEYEKDYVSVLDVVDIVTKLTLKQNFEDKIYNIASGQNVSAGSIAQILQQETGCDIVWNSSQAKETFPIIEIDKLKKQFCFKPRNVLDDLQNMINDFKRFYR